MATNILDYLDWRGDITLEADPFNEVDSIVFSQISYINFNGLISPDFSKKAMTIADASRLFFEAPDFQTRADNGPLINPATLEVLKKAGASERFGNMRVCGYADHIDGEQEKQFAALTFLPGDGTIFIAYRGTDNTLVGWKEDFNMAFMTPVPSQLEAQTYIWRAANELKGKIRTGGHSKGGNLAIYAAAFSGDRVRKRVIAIYNHDGPGFDQSVIDTDEFRAICPRIKTFIPQSSIVGMMLDHEEGYTVVESGESGIMQHDPLSWHIVGPRFVSLESITKKSQFIDQTLRRWLREMNKERREKFIDTLFSVISASEAKTVSDLSFQWAKNAGTILKALSKLDDETKAAVLQAVQILFRAAKESMPDLLDPAAPKRRFGLKPPNRQA
jgi:hypothetical protein